MDQFQLDIVPGESNAFWASVWIFNHAGRVVAEPRKNGANGSAGFRYMLPPGIYTIRLYLNGQFEDTRIELDRDMVVGTNPGDPTGSLKLPGLYSSAPLTIPNYKGNSSFDYYIWPAEKISEKETAHLFPAERQSLFIFLRFPSREIYNQQHRGASYWERFSLLDSQGKPLIMCPQGCVSESAPGSENDSSYLSLNIALPAGLYFLQYQGPPESRMVPLYVFQNHHTQFFMTVTGAPLFGSARIFIANERRFVSSDRFSAFIDLCLDKLQNGDYTIDENLLQMIAGGKWDSPMLGLLGAFLYLNGNERKNDALFVKIVSNLRQTILANNEDSPDLWALELLARERIGLVSSNPLQQQMGTPMLRVAYDAICRAGTRDPDVIPEGSLNDLIAERQLIDSPYNTFIRLEIPRQVNLPTFPTGTALVKISTNTLEPTQFKRFASFRDIRGFTDGENTDLTNIVLNFSRGKSETNFEDRQSEDLDASSGFLHVIREGVDPVLPKINQALPEPATWAVEAIRTLLSNKTERSDTDIACILGLPITTVARIRRTLDK